MNTAEGVINISLFVQKQAEFSRFMRELWSDGKSLVSYPAASRGIPCKGVP
jgi:hypothetical protein